MKTITVAAMPKPSRVHSAHYGGCALTRVLRRQHGNMHRLTLRPLNAQQFLRLALRAHGDALNFFLLSTTATRSLDEH